MGKFDDMRSNFLKLRGGKLISAESIILAVILFVMMMVNNKPFYLAVIVAAIIAFVFPVLVGVIKVIGWCVAIIFSLMWGILGGMIIITLIGSTIVGFIGGSIIFFASFRAHKNYSGLTFQGITLKYTDSSSFDRGHYIKKESIKFCPQCGRRIMSDSGICEVCNKKEI